MDVDNEQDEFSDGKIGEKDNFKNILEIWYGYIENLIDAKDNKKAVKYYLKLFKTSKRDENKTLNIGLSLLRNLGDNKLTSQFINKMYESCKKKHLKNFLFWFNFIFKIQDVPFDELYMIVSSAALKASSPIEFTLCGIVEVSVYRQKKKRKYIKKAYEHLKSIFKLDDMRVEYLDSYLYCLSELRANRSKYKKAFKHIVKFYPNSSLHLELFVKYRKVDDTFLRKIFPLIISLDPLNSYICDFYYPIVEKDINSITDLLFTRLEYLSNCENVIDLKKLYEIVKNIKDPDETLIEIVQKHIDLWIPINEYVKSKKEINTETKKIRSKITRIMKKLSKY